MKVLWTVIAGIIILNLLGVTAVSGWAIGLLIGVGFSPIIGMLYFAGMLYVKLGEDITMELLEAIKIELEFAKDVKMDK